MKLVLVNPDNELEAPSVEAITAAVAQVYAKAADAVILIADEANNLFMQLPFGGFHIEYCAGQRGPIYAHEDTPLELATTLFLCYARDDPTWRVAVPWQIFIKSI